MRRVFLKAVSHGSATLSEASATHIVMSTRPQAHFWHNGGKSVTRIVTISDVSSKHVLTGASCAFGVFDGVHVGHRFLIEQARKTAELSGGASVALTFSIDPDELFAADRLVKLMTNEERLDALARSGVDAVAVLPFDRAFAALSPEDFLELTFGENTPRFLHVGKGFRFGCRGSGTAETLRAWGETRGMEVRCHELLTIDGDPVSATRIRRLLSQGRVKEAERLLGRTLG